MLKIDHWDSPQTKTNYIRACINQIQLISKVCHLLFDERFVLVMGRNRDISTEKVAQMVILRQEGLQKEIASKLRVNQCLVSRHLKRYQSTGYHSGVPQAFGGLHASTNQCRSCS